MSTPKSSYPLANFSLSSKQSREVDKIAIQEFGIHSLVLMENAAANFARWICERKPPGKVLILCGRGNNGGDGLAIARHLEVAGWQVVCWLLGPIEQLSSDCRANFEILQRASDNICVFDSSSETHPNDMHPAMVELAPDVIIDAMLGTGVTGSPREPFSSWIRDANASAAFRVAVDVPTGVNPDTGEVYQPAFSADATVTFVTRKAAMAEPAKQSLFGELSVQPIGIPNKLVHEILTW